MSSTQTNTFTVADIRKVVENFAADFSMMVQATGLHSRDHVEKVVADLNIFAEFRYLVEVTLMLKDKDGHKIRAAVYKVSESAIGWTSERPGNNLWPRTPDGALLVIGTMSGAWNSKSDVEKDAFIKAHGLNWPWKPTAHDISLSGFASSPGQKYSSNGYGWERKNYG